MFRIVATLARGKAARACEDLACARVTLRRLRERQAAGFGRRDRPDRDGSMAHLPARVSAA